MLAVTTDSFKVFVITSNSNDNDDDYDDWQSSSQLWQQQPSEEEKEFLSVIHTLDWLAENVVLFAALTLTQFTESTAG